MSKETIEERREKALYWLRQQPGNAQGNEYVRTLLDDLMAEREKMKERIEELERELFSWDYQGP